MLKATATSSSKAARSKQTDRPEPLAVSSLRPGASPIVGEVYRILADGTLMVDFAGNGLGPIEARTLVEDLHAGAKVLLAFERGDPTRPIVLGLVYERARTQGRDLHLKASSVVIEAERGISLRCGDARVEASKDGKLRLCGKDVVSRASRTNKIQGSTVRLN